VVLRHELNDGSWHYDLLLQQASTLSAPTTPTSQTSHHNPDARNLVAFRLAPAAAGTSPTLTLARGVVLAATGTDRPHALATRMPDHRAHYLAFEGAIPGDRGTVKRVAQGTCTLLQIEPDFLRVRIAWNAEPIVTLEARLIADTRWLLTVH
jgi:hypothetical protein